MSSGLLLLIILMYFGLLLLVSWLTSRGSNNDSFFIGNRSSNWLFVAFGMIGASLSGVTFVSVPGTVGASGFGYLQITLGYIIGYAIVAFILLPLYYRMNLTSIYTYLQERMGFYSYKSGASIFIVSKLVGATARIYLVVNILQTMILDSFGVPFELTTIAILLMTILYTYEGGVKTIVWTDTLQTSAMLIGLTVCIAYILNDMNLNPIEGFWAMQEKGYTKVFDTNIIEKSFFVKQILAGVFITIAMTGIDQDMMQKTISVPNLKDSQKNMLLLSGILFVVIAMFLYMGGVLYLFAEKENITASGDALFPTIALTQMPFAIAIIFIIGLISALFSSADGAMTALTSSLCIDIFGIKEKDWEHQKKEIFRKKIHAIVAVCFLLMVLVFKWINDQSMIGVILKLAGFTYGPLLGLFAFGIFTKYKVKDNFVPYICIVAPTLSYILDQNQELLFGDFKIGLELLIINGLITFFGLWLIRKKN
ncbi:MAG: sodium:solute symporter [Flavobacteriaceae bacterium]|nr:sodium:solute symporter [Flavobacteriaceae bacterium]